MFEFGQAMAGQKSAPNGVVEKKIKKGRVK